MTENVEKKQSVRDRILGDTHITIDLETLGREADAPIVQLAAAEFDILTGEIKDTFQRQVSIKSLAQYNFTPQFDTVYWWLTSTSEEAKQLVFTQEDAINIRQVILEYKEWIATKSKPQFWCHAGFDAPVVRFTSRRVGFAESPMKYTKVRDIRGIQYLTEDCRPDKENYIAHDAAEDCKLQALWIARMINQLI